MFAAEALGGAALIVGFRTRYAAALLVPVMLGALRPHLSNGWMFTSAGGGWEHVAFLLVALVAQGLAGSGAYAVDDLSRTNSANMTGAPAQRSSRSGMSAG